MLAHLKMCCILPADVYLVVKGLNTGSLVLVSILTGGFSAASTSGNGQINNGPFECNALQGIIRRLQTKARLIMGKSIIGLLQCLGCLNKGSNNVRHLINFVRCRQKLTALRITYTNKQRFHNKYSI